MSEKDSAIHLLFMQNKLSHLEMEEGKEALTKLISHLGRGERANCI
jgi:hypothetical protein